MLFVNNSYAEPAYIEKCIENKNIVINGISLGDDAKQSLQKLGTPLNIEKGYSEDDGGQFLVTKYTFHNLIVEISRDEVSLIQALNNKVSSSYGLSIGAHLSDIERNIGISIQRNAKDKNPIYIGICPGETTFLAIYHETYIVTGFKVFYEGP